MDTIFSILLLLLVLLFYFSNRKNKANQWAALAGFIFWLGVFKEAFYYELVPHLTNLLGDIIPHSWYASVYSAQTWLLYSFAMPTVLVFALYFCNLDTKKPRLFRLICAIHYGIALLLSVLFPPLSFREYQMTSLFFWILYSTFNLSLGVFYVVFLIKGVYVENRRQLRRQKKLVMGIVVPPVVYWLLTIFLIHPLELNKYFNLWQGNILIILLCIIVYIIMAFRDGMMGLKLTGQTYTWNTDFTLINKGAQYTSHMLKNQAAKMEWCLENLKRQYESVPEHKSIPEEMFILSRSIENLKHYVKRIKKQSDPIQLNEEKHSLQEMLEDALSRIAASHTQNVVQFALQEDVLLLCDRSHMTEVFVNILSNGLEAISDGGTIRVTTEYSKKNDHFPIHFQDTGIGISEENLEKIFAPYFTTKNTEKNFGLGLTYCLNVLEKHEGTITAQSVLKKGTTITTLFPIKRVTTKDGRQCYEQENQSCISRKRFGFCFSHSEND